MKIVFQPWPIDIILGEQDTHQFIKGYRLLNQVPDAGSNRIEPIVQAGLKTQNRNLAGEVGRNLIFGDNYSRGIR